MKKKINALLAFLALIATINLSAGISIDKTGSGMFPLLTGDFSMALPTSYYNICVLQIHSLNFGDQAMDGGAYGIEPTMSEFQTYEDKILDTINETNQDKIKNIAAVFSTLRKYLIKSSGTNDLQLAKINQQQRELRMEHEASLETEVEKAKSTSFGDTAPEDAPAEGSMTYDFIKNLCKKNKMYEKTQGVDARKKIVEASSKKAKKNVSKRQDIASVISEVRKKQDKHYNLFCSQDEKEQGLCENISILPSADIMADNFLTPEGFKEENAAISTEYKTIYTYNQVEALGADAFMSNMVGFMPVNPPTPEERKNPKKTKFVALYNQLVSSLNLSSYIFENSYQNRLPKNSSGVRMGILDTLNYMIVDMNSMKSKTLEGQLDGNGYLMAYQTVLALKTKLEMEKLIQKERLKLLEATTLGLMENSRENLQNLDKKK